MRFRTMFYQLSHNLEWITCSLLQADTVLGAFSEFLMYDSEALFITQLICLSAPLLYIIIVRPFRDWLKNVASVCMYCISILAIVAPICPEDAQVPLGYIIVILMFLVCVALIIIPIVRTLKRQPPISHSSLGNEQMTEIMTEPSGIQSLLLLKHLVCSSHNICRSVSD